MPRQARLRAPDGVVHITARGNRRQPIYVDDHDHRLFLRILGDVVGMHSWRCGTFCLMPNHFHVVAQTPGDSLSVGMHRLNGRYAQWFNERHGFTGHLFQGRFGSVVVEDERHLLEVIRYVALNPVKAGLCRRPESWRWSSYRSLEDAAQLPFVLALDDVFELFGGEPAEARRRLVRFVEDGMLGL